MRLPTFHSAFQKVERPMKNLFIGLCVLALVAATSCNRSAPEKQEAAAPAARQSPEKAVQTVAKKPIAGEAEHTFSLSVPFESVTLTQGERESVRIGINRGQNFGEEVTIKVTGLPAGVTVETANPVIKYGSTDVTLTLKAASDAALGDFTANVTGYTASSSDDFSKEIKITVAQK